MKITAQYLREMTRQKHNKEIGETLDIILPKIEKALIEEASKEDCDNTYTIYEKSEINRYNECWMGKKYIVNSLVEVLNTKEFEVEEFGIGSETIEIKISW